MVSVVSQAAAEWSEAASYWPKAMVVQCAFEQRHIVISLFWVKSSLGKMTASLAILNQTGKQCFLKCLMNMGTLKRLENIISIFLDKLLSWHLPSVILQMLDPMNISFAMACCFLLLSDTNPSKALLASNRLWRKNPLETLTAPGQIWEEVFKIWNIF